MRRVYEIFIAILVILLIVGTMLAIGPLNVYADTANAPSLIISQLKITSSNGQFITLYNPSSSVLDMSKFQLEYFNNYDLSKATSSRLIALSGTVAPHGYFMVNDDDLLLCYKLTVDSVSLGLSSTAGLVQVLGLNQSSSGGSVSPVLDDYVGWSKTAATGAQTLPPNTSAFLQRKPVDISNNPLITVPGAGSWIGVQPDAANPCNLVTATNSISTSLPIASGLSQLLPSNEPPVTIVNVIDGSSTQTLSSVSNLLPAGDIGLMAPQLTEILPNPAGSGNDSSDEFIEIYNPNPAVFDLSGFGLQSGTTSLHNYIFPNGTSLPPLSFTSFYSSKTALSLSNSGGQVRLLDPSSTSISLTAVYGSAKDGQSWALAQGKWFWTTDVTPGLANIIRMPVVSAKSSSGSAKTSATASKSKSKSSKAAKKPKVAKAKKAKKTPVTHTSAGIANAAQKTQIHLGILALVGGLALLYVAYEYRADLANFYYKLRRNVGAGKEDRA